MVRHGVSPSSIPVPRRRVRLARGRSAAEGGQASVLMAGVVVLAAVVLLALVTAGGVAIDGARARTAADAAALAGAAQGEAAARRQAAANDGDLTSYAAAGEEVQVTVTVGRGRATARARREGSWCHDQADAGQTRSISYSGPPCPSTPA